MSPALASAEEWVRPGAFCTDGERLYEVVRVFDTGGVTFENCVSHGRVTYKFARMTLVRRAPEVPADASALAA